MIFASILYMAFVCSLQNNSQCNGKFDEIFWKVDNDKQKGWWYCAYARDMAFWRTLVCK